VALEMAHRLRALGEEVPLLILMDTPCREVLPGPPPDEALLAQVLPREIALAPGELRGLDPEGQLTCAVDRMQAEGTLPPGFDFAETRRLLAVLRNNIAALFAYDLQAYDGRALFFRAVERRPQDPARPELPWIDLATGGIEIHVVPGNHATMHEPPHVRILAERLRRCLGSPASAELATH
jgi:thioesterase domain-containing protein